MKMDAGQVEQDFATLDALAHFVARHLEDATSNDPAVRRRFGRLVGLLAERAARCAALPLSVLPTE